MAECNTQDAFQNDKYIYCDTPIQFVNQFHTNLPSNKPKTNLVLSIMPVQKQITERQLFRLYNTPVVTAYYENRKVNRNIFIAERIPGSGITGPLVYEEEFYIRLRDTEGGKLYLMGVFHSKNVVGTPCDKVPICLINQPNDLCKFKFTDPVMPDKKVFLVGVPVESFKSVCVVHLLSGQKLAVLLSHFVSNICRDHEVCAFNFRGNKGRKSSANYWQICPVTKAKISKDSEDVQMDYQMENA